METVTGLTSPIVYNKPGPNINLEGGRVSFQFRAIKIFKYLSYDEIISKSESSLTGYGKLRES